MFLQRQMTKWLVLLDVDGTLCTRMRNNKNKEIRPQKEPDYTRKGVKAWFRPHAREFVSTLFEKGFDVGTWTSASETHGDPLVKSLLGIELYDKLLIKVRKKQTQLWREELNRILGI